MTGAGVSGESGQAPVLIAVLERWKDLGSVAHLVPSVAENIARGEIMRFSRVRVLVRSKVGTGLCSALSLLLIISVSSPPYSLQRTGTQWRSGQFSINILYLGLIISGGGPSSSYKSVEVFVPSTGQHCTLPDLPAGRFYCTMDGMVLCGGGDSDTSCTTLTDAGWRTTTTLLERR